jgi:uncharacterized protein YjbJ (UPF0337 family)
MDEDRIAGSAKVFVGKVEGTVGDIAGDAKTQPAGRDEATDAAVSYAKDAYENSGDTFRDGFNL